MKILFLVKSHANFEILSKYIHELGIHNIHLLVMYKLDLTFICEVKFSKKEVNTEIISHKFYQDDGGVLGLYVT